MCPASDVPVNGTISIDCAKPKNDLKGRGFMAFGDSGEQSVAHEFRIRVSREKP
jgi:hypothetical protein